MKWSAATGSDVAIEFWTVTSTRPSACAGAVAEIGEHRPQPLMRLRMMGVDLQGTFVMFARLLIACRAQQQIGEIDARQRIVRVMLDRLCIDAAGGIDCAHPGEQRAEFVQGAEMRGRAPQDRDEGVLGILMPVQRRQQHRSLRPLAQRH